MIIISKNKKGVNYYIFVVFTVFVFIVGGYFDTILNAFKIFTVIAAYVFFLDMSRTIFQKLHIKIKHSFCFYRQQ